MLRESSWNISLPVPALLDVGVGRVLTVEVAWSHPDGWSEQLTFLACHSSVAISAFSAASGACRV